MNPKVREDGRYEVIRTAGPDGRRLPDHTRSLVLRRDRVQCVWCGSKGRLEVDHIIPWSAGGTDDMDNLRTLCHDCNQRRSNYASESDIQPKRFYTAHECVYCNPALIGDPEVRQVYCIMCNKRAPGLPINPPEEESKFVEIPESQAYLERVRELEELAAKHRAEAIATIKAALGRGVAQETK